MNVSEEKPSKKLKSVSQLGYLEAVRGKLMAEKRRSDIASEITKAVVA